MAQPQPRGRRSLGRESAGAASYGFWPPYGSPVLQFWNSKSFVWAFCEEPPFGVIVYLGETSWRGCEATVRRQFWARCKFARSFLHVDSRLRAGLDAAPWAGSDPIVFLQGGERASACRA